MKRPVFGGMNRTDNLRQDVSNGSGWMRNSEDKVFYCQKPTVACIYNINIPCRELMMNISTTGIPNLSSYIH